MAHGITDATIEATVPAAIDAATAKQGKPRGQKHTPVMHADDQAEARTFHHNALNVLGPNYLVRKWLPLKGPAFIALIQSMRAYIFYDFESGQQRTHLFPSMATIAQRTGMGQRTIYRLLRDPDMQLFITRRQRRRYSEEYQREVQTTNIWFVAMDDPPVPEDLPKVRQAQRLREALERGEDLDEWDDHPHAKSSDCQNGSLNALPKWQSQCSAKMADEDRIFTTHSHEGVRRSPEEEVAGETIGRGRSAPGRRTKDAAQNNEPDRETDPHGEIRAKRIASDRPTYENAAPPLPCTDVPDAALLSEGAAWKTDARVAAGGIIADNLRQMGADGVDQAVEAVLAAHAPYCTPPEILGHLADIARHRTLNRGGHIGDGQKAGYYIKVLCNLAGEAKRMHYDLSKLSQKAASAARKAQAQERQAQGLPVTPSQSAYMPRQTAHNRAGLREHTSTGDDYYDRLKAASYGR